MGKAGPQPKQSRRWGHAQDEAALRGLSLWGSGDPFSCNERLPSLRAAPGSTPGDPAHTPAHRHSVQITNQRATETPQDRALDSILRDPVHVPSGGYLNGGPVAATLEGAEDSTPRWPPAPSTHPAGADSRIHLGWGPETGGCQGRRCHSQGCSARSNRKQPGDPRRIAAAGCHPAKEQKPLNKWHMGVMWGHREPARCLRGGACPQLIFLSEDHTSQAGLPASTHPPT